MKRWWTLTLAPSTAIVIVVACSDERNVDVARPAEDSTVGSGFGDGSPPTPRPCGCDGGIVRLQLDAGPSFELTHAYRRTECSDAPSLLQGCRPWHVLACSSADAGPPCFVSDDSYGTFTEADGATWNIVESTHRFDVDGGFAVGELHARMQRQDCDACTSEVEGTFELCHITSTSCE